MPKPRHAPKRLRRSDAALVFDSSRHNRLGWVVSAPPARQAQGGRRNATGLYVLGTTSSEVPASCVPGGRGLRRTKPGRRAAVSDIWAFGQSCHDHGRVRPRRLVFPSPGPALGGIHHPQALQTRQQARPEGGGGGSATSSAGRQAG